MVELVSAKCPSCGAALKLSKEDERTVCEYCHQTIIVDDAVACYKLKINGSVSVNGIESNSDLIEAANDLLEMNEFLKAKRKFLEFSEKCPNNYQGWLGLLICRTRNFTIKDNNILFENDVNKYYEHFKKVAPEEIKKEYIETIENYLHPKVQPKNISESNSRFKIDSKVKPYIAPVIIIILGTVLLSHAIFIGGLLWILAGLVLIPQIKDKFEFSTKKAIIISVILGITGFFAFGLESPPGYVRRWEAIDANYSIEFKRNNIFVLKTSEGEIEGTYSDIYENDQYTITLSTQNEKYNNVTYKYSSSSSGYKKLCLYKNHNCTTYFRELE